MQKQLRILVFMKSDITFLEKRKYNATFLDKSFHPLEKLSFGLIFKNIIRMMLCLHVRLCITSAVSTEVRRGSWIFLSRSFRWLCMTTCELEIESTFTERTPSALKCWASSQGVKAVTITTQGLLCCSGWHEHLCSFPLGSVWAGAAGHAPLQAVSELIVNK